MILLISQTTPYHLTDEHENLNLRHIYPFNIIPNLVLIRNDLEVAQVKTESK